MRECPRAGWLPISGCRPMRRGGPSLLSQPARARCHQAGALHPGSDKAQGDLEDGGWICSADGSGGPGPRRDVSLLLPVSPLPAPLLGTVPALCFPRPWWGLILPGAGWAGPCRLLHPAECSQNTAVVTATAHRVPISASVGWALAWPAEAPGATPTQQTTRQRRTNCKLPAAKCGLRLLP